MPQKSLDGERGDVGIECFVRCVSNKRDEVKSSRSIALNFDIRVNDKLIGKGNNLNINNLTDEEYDILCRAFGLDRIDDRVPFVAVLYTAGDHEKKKAWEIAMARRDGNVDDDQTDITDDPSKASKKQVKFINDLQGKKVSADAEIQACLESHDVGEVKDLPKEAASELIDHLKELMDIPEDDGGETEEKPKRGRPKKK